MAVVDQTQNASLPEFFDLRQEQNGCFTPVVNQGQCGSCWSFAVANAISDAYAIQNAKANGKDQCDKYSNFSEEDLLNCSPATEVGKRCDGGIISQALDQVAKNGLTTEKCNPYGHGGGTDALGQGGCPTTCKGEGSIDNKVTAVGQEGPCTDSDNGATDPQGDGCSVQNTQVQWCGLQDDDDFNSKEMCCGCKGAKYVTLTTTAEIQSYLVESGPMTVGMPVQPQMYGVGAGIYKPAADQGTTPGGHAIECLGWGHDEDGAGFWIMKNSWGCNWGDSGQFKQSWAFNAESTFQGLKINGSGNFVNDVPQDEEPECKVPEDSNNSDHCAQQSEFDTCKLCNSAYELTADSTCVLKDEEIEEVADVADDDDETPSEDIFWQQCKTNGGNGQLCPADAASNCFVLSDGSEVECSTWIDIVAQNKLSTNCSLCPSNLIDNCATQSGDKCLECVSGFSASETMDVCLSDSCAATEESTADGDCVTPPANCAPGSSTLTDTGDVHCTACKPGFEMDAGECLALPDPANCAQVELSNPERTCNVCNEGQYAGPYGKCHPNEEKGDSCQDSDNGAHDSYGDGCSAYNDNVGWCGLQDDDDFDSMSMCCGCKATYTAKRTLRVKRSRKLNKAKKHTPTKVTRKTNTKSTKKLDQKKKSKKRTNNKRRSTK